MLSIAPAAAFDGVFKLRAAIVMGAPSQASATGREQPKKKPGRPVSLHRVITDPAFLQVVAAKNILFMAVSVCGALEIGLRYRAGVNADSAARERWWTSAAYV